MIITDVQFPDPLSHRARSAPERLAVRVPGRDVSYAELDELARRAAGGLAARGVGEGDLVAIDLDPGLDHVAAFWGTAKLGAVAFPLGRRLAPREREGLLEQAEPALVVSGAGWEGDSAAPFGEAPRGSHDAGRALCRIATSGTSGAPRLVALTHGNFLWSAAGSAFALGVDPGDRWLCCLPLNHVGGLSILTRSAIYGTAAVVHPGFDPERVADSLARDGVTLVSLVAAQLVRLLEEGVDLTGPRAIVLGGGPVPADALAEAEERGARVAQTYGLTEACSQVTLLPPSEAPARRGSAGRAVLGAEVRTDGGEILVRGPVVAPGAAGEDGWLRTGDLGRLDADGFLWVEGRGDDVIVTGGENVAPWEVERVLLEHPDVADAAVVGRPDPRWGRAVSAFLVPRAGAEPSPDALRAHCAERLAPYKVPKSFELRTELPRTRSGKLRRAELRGGVG